jgi:hypothetical protein
MGRQAGVARGTPPCLLARLHLRHGCVTTWQMGTQVSHLRACPLVLAPAPRAVPVGLHLSWWGAPPANAAP